MSIQFGVELEMKNIRGSDIVEIMNQTGNIMPAKVHTYMEGRNWRASRGSQSPGPFSGQWKMVEDSSINGYSCSMESKGSIELVSPVLFNEAGRANFFRILDGLKATTASVDISCGTHISVGLDGKARWVAMSVANKAKVANRMVAFYQHFQPVFDAISPNCRKANTTEMSVGMMGAHFMDENGTEGCGRYTVLNLDSYITYGRVEFRQPGFTLDKQNLGRWLKIINSVVSMSLNENHCSRTMTLSEMPQTVDGFATYLGLSNAMRENVRARVLSLYNNHRRGRVERLAVLWDGTPPAATCRYCNAHHDCPAWPDCGGSNPDGSEAA